MTTVAGLLQTLVGLVALSSCAPSGLRAEPNETRLPNLVLVMTDDQGYWDTGYHGNEKIDTPTLDRLAEQAVRLERFYAAPVCAPTRAGVLTGRYYLRTGLYNTRFGGDSLGLDEITLAELLQQAGYRTGLFGKWHLGQYAGHQPQHRGFDEFFGHYHGHIERYEFADQLVHNGRPVASRGYVTDLFTDAAIEFIHRNQDHPFFCFVSYNAPHSPHVLETSHYGQPRGDKTLAQYLERGLDLREARIYAMVERIDTNLGRLLDALDQRDLQRDTLVFFMSDNGGVSRSFSAGLRGRKASVYEGGVRVPALAYWPERLPPATVRQQTSHVDLLPTFCELAGVDLPGDRTLDGRSLWPLLAGEKPAEPLHPFVYHTWARYQPNPNQRYAISDGRFKLLANGATPADPEAPGPKPALYDLQQDPGETRDVANAHPEVVKNLREEFLRWFEEVTAGQDYRPAPIPVGDPRQPGAVELQASWADLEGPHIHYTFEGYDWDTIDSWRQAGEQARWRLNVVRPGTYRVVAAYGCQAPGAQLEIRVGDQAVTFKPVTTPTANVFRRDTLGSVQLEPGQQPLTVSVQQAAPDEAVRLNRLWLIPARPAP